MLTRRFSRRVPDRCCRFLFRFPTYRHGIFPIGLSTGFARMTCLLDPDRSPAEATESRSDAEPLWTRLAFSWIMSEFVGTFFFRWALIQKAYAASVSKTSSSRVVIAHFASLSKLMLAAARMDASFSRVNRTVDSFLPLCEASFTTFTNFTITYPIGTKFGLRLC